MGPQREIRALAHRDARGRPARPSCFSGRAGRSRCADRRPRGPGLGFWQAAAPSAPGGPERPWPSRPEAPAETLFIFCSSVFLLRTSTNGSTTVSWFLNIKRVRSNRKPSAFGTSSTRLNMGYAEGIQRPKGQLVCKLTTYPDPLRGWFPCDLQWQLVWTLLKAVMLPPVDMLTVLHSLIPKGSLWLCVYVSQRSFDYLFS